MLEGYKRERRTFTEHTGRNVGDKGQRELPIPSLHHLTRKSKLAAKMMQYQPG